jgi:uncharacterized surface protein with fasciclin (FAS1) repeats
VLTGAAVAAGAALPGRVEAQAITLMQIIDASPDMSRFAALIRQAGLERLFTQPGQIGIFVPLNAAVERLSAHRLRELDQSLAALQRTIRHHVTDFTPVPGRCSATSDFAQILNALLAHPALQPSATARGSPPQPGDRQTEPEFRPRLVPKNPNV